MRVYISGALMGAENIEAEKLKYEKLASLLAACHVEVYLPHLHTDPVNMKSMKSVDVYRRDMVEMLKSQLLVAFIDVPSLGVGAEIVLALRNNLKVVALKSRGRPVSRFVEGLLITENATIVEYDELKEVQQQILYISKG